MMMPASTTLLAHLGDGDTKDLFRRLLERGMQELIDAELTATIGAELHERTDTRTNQRNGARERTLSTPAVISSCGSRSCVSGRSSRRLLEPRRRVDQALWAVIMTAYITGTSTRKVDDLVRALGCAVGGVEVDVSVGSARALITKSPCSAPGHSTIWRCLMYLDATYIKARNNHRIVVARRRGRHGGHRRREP